MSQVQQNAWREALSWAFASFCAADAAFLRGDEGAGSLLCGAAMIAKWWCDSKKADGARIDMGKRGCPRHTRRTTALGMGDLAAYAALSLPPS